MIKGLVSVIIPTYKRPTMLGRAIESVLNQTYDNIEIAVIDDNNTGDEFREETIEFMQQYKDNPKVIYIQHEYNQNGSAARNTGISQTQGEYIAFLDDDDCYLPSKIAAQVAILSQQTENCGGVYSNYVKRYKNKIYKISSYKEDNNSSYDLLSGKVDLAAGSTLLLRRSVIDDIGFFDTSFARHQDWEFLIRVFRKYFLAISPEIGVVISADDRINRPNTNKLIEVKLKLFEMFKPDIEKMDHLHQVHIYEYQNFELICSALREKKYSLAFNLYKNQNYKLSILKKNPHLFLAFLTGLCSYTMVTVYNVLGFKNFFKKRKLYKVIKNNKYFCL